MMRKLGLNRLNDDFLLPGDGKVWKHEKELGHGAYGKVMECNYIPHDYPFAIKRFENIFTIEQRGTRLLREITILDKVRHPCLNKLVTIFPPPES